MFPEDQSCSTQLRQLLRKPRRQYYPEATLCELCTSPHCTVCSLLWQQFETRLQVCNPTHYIKWFNSLNFRKWQSRNSERCTLLILWRMIQQEALMEELERFNRREFYGYTLRSNKLTHKLVAMVSACHKGQKTKCRSRDRAALQLALIERQRFIPEFLLPQVLLSLTVLLGQEVRFSLNQRFLLLNPIMQIPQLDPEEIQAQSSW